MAGVKCAAGVKRAQKRPFHNIHPGSVAVGLNRRAPEAGYSSGGFMANCQLNKTVFGSQQQFFIRNSELDGEGGVWNMVYVGSKGAPPSHCDNADSKVPVTTVDKTPVIAEKPFITIDSAGKYSINVPPVTKASVGTDFVNPKTQKIPFEQVYVAQPTDTAKIINAQLSSGLNVVLSPGIYSLEAPLLLGKAGQVLMGLGW